MYDDVDDDDDYECVCNGDDDVMVTSVYVGHDDDECVHVCADDDDAYVLMKDPEDLGVMKDSDALFRDVVYPVCHPFRKVCREVL